MRDRPAEIAASRLETVAKTVAEGEDRATIRRKKTMTPRSALVRTCGRTKKCRKSGRMSRVYRKDSADGEHVADAFGGPDDELATRS